MSLRCELTALGLPAGPWVPLTPCGWQGAGDVLPTHPELLHFSQKIPVTAPPRPPGPLPSSPVLREGGGIFHPVQEVTESWLSTEWVRAL